MRIAQIAPLWELVPPATYGGTELVVHLLSEEMVRRGHEVTLFAAEGSQTSAYLSACAPMALRNMEEKLKVDKTHCTVMAYELGMLGQVFARAQAFDVIHNHMGFQPLAFADRLGTPMVTTLHNALEPEPVRDLFYRHAHLPYISISDYQRQLWPELNYAATIHHGIDLAAFEPEFTLPTRPYLVFLGRLSPEKGPQHAIAAARALNMKLILAGKIDRVDRLFYEREIAQWVDGEQITYVGEVDHAQKVRLLRHAAACLCPVEWPEPFGLVMIESMACGTPVFALRDGSVPEVIDHGQSGYVADSVPALIEAVAGWQAYSRHQVRRIAEQRFSVHRMVDEHVALYESLAAKARTEETSQARFISAPQGGFHRFSAALSRVEQPPTPKPAPLSLPAHASPIDAFIDAFPEAALSPFPPPDPVSLDWATTSLASGFELAIVTEPPTVAESSSREVKRAGRPVRKRASGKKRVAHAVPTDPLDYFPEPTA